MAENFARFTLSYNSPLLQSLIIDKVGLFAEKEVGKQIISQGAVQFEGESDLKTLLSLFYKDNSTNIYNFLDIVTWKTHWKRATDHASSSFSGLLFGYYRSQASDLILSDVACSLINIEIRNSTLLRR